MDEGRNMVLLFPTLLNLDTPQLRENFQPQYVLSQLIFDTGSNRVQMPHLLHTTSSRHS